MTISSTTNRVSYAGDGSTTVFSYPHRFLEDDDLLVIVVDDSTGAETEQTLSTDYTVSGAGDDNGGSITFTSAPASGKTIVILNDPDITQGYDPEDGSALAANSLETAFDRLTLINQRQSDQISRAFRKSDGDTSGAATVLPVPIENRSFKYVSDGNGGLELGLTSHDPDEAQEDATAAKDAAEAAQTAAETAESNAEGHETAAQTARTGAETAESNAEAWAEGTEPGGAGTKSAKEWAETTPEKLKWLSRGIGEIYVVDDSLTGADVPPTDDDQFRFIKLTDGLTGAGQYNEGLLTSESVTGTAPLVVATAVIDDAESPMDGQTIHLANTEKRYLMPGTSPGTVANDQMQQITGNIRSTERDNGNQYDNFQGAFSRASSGSSDGPASTTGVDRSNLSFDSADSPDARTGDHTNVKHMQVTAYMRIK